MKFKPIIIVPGEPNSIFFEIFFKSIKNSYKNPIILIASKKLLLNQSSSGPNLLAPVNPSSTATLSKKNIHSKKPSAF